MRTWPAIVLTFPASDPEGDLEDRVSAELDGRKVTAVAERADDTWQVCFDEEGARDEAAAALTTAFAHRGLVLESLAAPDEDWARRSQAELGAIRVGAVTVTPPWDEAARADHPGGTVIVIEPAMGFGSGHHATTRLCLAALQRTDIRHRRVLDVGTGSGVLALTAARLGAAPVVGIDVDPDALENARSNAARNGLTSEVTFSQADVRTAVLTPADVVIANLTGGMLEASVTEIVRCCAPKGQLILSGITAEEADSVSAAYREQARQDWSATEDGWWAYAFSIR